MSKKIKGAENFFRIGEQATLNSDKWWDEYHTMLGFIPCNTCELVGAYLDANSGEYNKIVENICGYLETFLPKKVKWVAFSDDDAYEDKSKVAFDSEKDCYILPDFLRYEDAVLIEPTTIAVQACSRAQLNAEDELLIMGCGALGSRMLSIAKLHGCKIIVADVVDEKLAEAKQNGADYTVNLLKEDLAEKCKEYTTDEYGPTVSIDCACTKDSLGTCIKVTGNAGRVITMGFSVAPTEVTNFGITSKELDIRGSRLQNRKFQEVIDLVNAGKVDLDHKISHTYHFTDAQAAFDFNDTRDPSIRKIVLTMD